MTTAPAPILIVNDDETLNHRLSSRFASAGRAVEIAQTEEEAIERLRASTFSAVILDPAIRHGLNGYSVLNWIQRHRPELMDSCFLVTALSEETIARTIPAALPRFHRRGADVAALVNAVLDGTGGDGRPPKGSILLIEDDPITASVLRTIATELGWNADVVHSGRIGLQRLMTRDYAAVMLDVVLPDLDGYAILDALSRANPEMLSRVIIVTGLPEQYLSPMVESRVHSVVRKPIDAVQLTDELRRCASRFEPPIEAGGEIPTSL